MTNDPTASDEIVNPVQARLAKIADALGCPIEVFTAGAPMSGDRARAVELLRLWESIPSAAAREDLLAFARSLVRN